MKNQACEFSMEIRIAHQYLVEKNVGLFLGKHESEDWISFCKFDHDRYIVWNCLLLIPGLTNFNDDVSGVWITLGNTKETDTYLLE